MELGQYYYKNQNRISSLTEDDWKVALKKCKDHIRWRLKQKTLYGAHSASSLGADPVEHYLGLSHEKILVGEWEWKDGFSLTEQMIRIVNSCISKEVEKTNSVKRQSFKVIYTNIEEELYVFSEVDSSADNDNAYEVKLQSIEAAVCGDEQLVFLIEALKEGKKRTEIAELLEIHPRQLDKLREKLIRKIKNYQSSSM